MTKTTQSATERIAVALSLLDEKTANHVIGYAMYLAAHNDCNQEAQHNLTAKEISRNVFLSDLDEKQRRTLESIEATEDFQADEAEQYELTIGEMLLIKETHDTGINGLMEMICDSFALGFYKGICYSLKHSPHTAVKKIRRVVKNALLKSYQK